MQYKYTFSKTIKDKLKEKEEEKNKTNVKEEKSDDNNENKNLKNSISNTDSSNNSLKDKPVKDIIEDLKDIYETYQRKDYIDAPETLGLETKTIEEKTDQDFLDQAKKSLDEKYKNKSKQTSDTFEEKINSVLAKKEEDLNKYNSDKKEINDIYNQSIVNTEDQALKRGLARSSIVINQLANIENEKASELSNLLSNYTKSIEEKELEIKNLSEQKDEALNELDISYALELDEKITDLKNEYMKEKDEIIEFNNQVKKLEAEYKIKLENEKQEKQSHLNELEKEYGVDVTQSIISEKQFEYLKAYFDCFDKDYSIALFLNNKEFKDLLKNNYQRMYQYLISR